MPLPIPRVPPVTMAVHLRSERETGMGNSGIVVGLREPIARKGQYDEL